MKRIFACLLTVALALLVIPNQAIAKKNDRNPNVNVRPIERKVMDAVAILYARNDSGSMQMMCTATAYEKTRGKYRFVTASHCVAEDHFLIKKSELAPATWFLSLDTPGNEKQEFYPAKVLRAGYQSSGNDFAVLEAMIDREIPVVPAAKTGPKTGEEIVNIAAPYGLGKQIFRGHVIKDRIDRNLEYHSPFFSINWTGGTLLQMPTGGGASGLAIVSRDRKEIVAILVGYYGNLTVALPIDRFNEFKKGLGKGKRKGDTEDLLLDLFGNARNSTERSQAPETMLDRILKRCKNGLRISAETNQAVE
ncbi:trypsin-like peptidase domain-containing protein [Candidatus Uhrbacteria bacterium]|nr:trypsin-like peptidase domain-containing protein [Candidatus Uhrbacteria bacterium]